MAPPSFIESGFLTRVEYEKALASGMAGATVSGGAPMELGYWKIRGLAAACRMMFHFKSTSFKNVAYGEDAKTEWFGKDKVELAKKNAMINLPYIVDGNTVVTQSNSCLIYLGQKLGIDAAEHMIHNHQVLDQTMDLRNDLMKIIYNPAHADFKPALEGHMKGAATHLAKLEGFCKGPFMCGPAMQSGDFHVFEMIDQHVMMCSELGAAFDLKAYPKLATLHTRVKNTPELSAYFKSDMHAKYAVNNAQYANYVGKGYGKGPFGPTLREEVKIVAPEPKKKGGGGPAAQAKQTPEEKAAAAAAKDKEKARQKIIKEGGKKGVEIEGASELGGLDFFCTTVELPEGDVELLELAMTAMNAEPDPEAEDRKGCSGLVGKMIFSAGVEQLAMVAYVPDKEYNKSADKVDVQTWMEDVCKAVDGTVVKASTKVISLIPDKRTGALETDGKIVATNGKTTGSIVCAVVKSNPEKGKFALKDKDAAMAAAFGFLRAKGAFPEDDGDDSDEMIFGDDDNLDDYA